MIDTHAHLNHSDFADDLPGAVARARAAGVNTIVNVGYDLASSRDALQLAEEFDGLYATIGLHPHSALEYSDDLLRELQRLMACPGVVAVGETGLDYYRDLAPRDAQRVAFRGLAQAAVAANLPLVVHNRDAHADTLEILAEIVPPEVPVIMHCFSGDQEFARECRERDYYLGVTGPISYPKNQLLRDIVAVYPGKRLLLETDCPWLAPQSHRGRRNEPSYLPEIAVCVAEVRGEPLPRIEEQTVENTRRVFRLPPEGDA
ncbi:MAG TPA: TatD family hydrolase [Armatimonadota bacterium]|jgi:TatD DNase family protein